MNWCLHFNNANMKTILVVIVLTALHLEIKCNESEETKIIIKSQYPRKAARKESNIKIINARKFDSLHSLESRKVNKEKRKRQDPYTAFPPIADKRLFDVLDVTYIPSERKPRIKKVLSEYGFSVFRNKRSVKHKVNNDNTNITDIAKIDRKTKENGTRNKSKRIKKNKANSKTSGKKNKRTNQKAKSGTNNTRQGNLRSYARNEVKKRNKGRKSKRQKIKEISRRLIAGKDAVIQDFPYVVSIQKGNEHWCAGALLNPRLVITTANCIWKARSISRMRIRAGSRYMERGGQVAKIDEVVKHPAWSIRSHPDNDVGLLLLDRNIKFSDSVHGVDLPNRAMVPAFEDVFVTSWGSDRRDGIFETVGVALQVYHAKVVDHDQCNNITQRFGVAVTRNFICIAQTGRRAPCTRDTGAPAVSDGILWGLASWGIRKLCGTERFPAMFSYLASRSNLDFITNATHYLMSDKRFNPYPDRFAVYRAETTLGPANTP